MGLAQTVSRLIAKNSPVIMTSIGVVGVLTTAVLTGKATLEAQMMLDYYEKEALSDKHFTGFTFTDKVKIVWKQYIPVVISGSVTIACIIGAQKVNIRRQAALMSLYSLSETALKEYKDKVVETYGETKERKIRDAIAEDHVNSAIANNSSIIVTGSGNVLCYDELSGRLFNSDMETIRRAQNDMNAEIINNMCISLNEFYTKLGIPQTALGDEVGWDTDNMLAIDYHGALTEDNRPCIALNYKTHPRNGYSGLH